MKLTRLRIVGFKSFVEPTDFLIEPGLTGVVGPNGCGKSNLVEALRWVMGETSHKNMRASGMDDVIFSGSGEPAGAQHRRGDALHRQRRPHGAGRLQRRRRAGGLAPIEREAGSTYRINGRRCAPATCRSCSRTPPPARARRPSCARARSARSSPPSPRRAAASWRTPPASPGLHTRRHEAELRLKAAEDNLVRVEDVLRELESPDREPEAAGPPGLALQEPLGRDPPPRGAAVRHRLRRGARAGRGRRAPGRPRTSRRSPTRTEAQTEAATGAGRRRPRASRPCARRRPPRPRPCSG